MPHAGGGTGQVRRAEGGRVAERRRAGRRGRAAGERDGDPAQCRHQQRQVGKREGDKPPSPPRLSQGYKNSRPGGVKYCFSTRSTSSPTRFYHLLLYLELFLLFPPTFEKNRPCVPDLFQLLQVAEEAPHEDLQQLSNKGEAL